VIWLAVQQCVGTYQHVSKTWLIYDDFDITVRCHTCTEWRVLVVGYWRCQVVLKRHNSKNRQYNGNDNDNGHTNKDKKTNNGWKTFGGFRVANFFLVFCVVFFVLFVFSLWHVYPMLPVSVNCPFFIAPSVFSSG
jgi:hypothetical protein